MSTDSTHPAGTSSAAKTEAELGTMSVDELEEWSAGLDRDADDAFDQADPIDGDPSPAPDPTRRSHVFAVRLTGAELDTIRAQAEQAGMKVGAYVRTAALAGGSVERLQIVRHQLEDATAELARLTG